MSAFDLAEIGGRWDNITCADRDRIWTRQSDRLRVAASLTDHEGQYGPPTIYTEWYDPATDLPALEDTRYPDPHGGGEDVAPCRHRVYVRPLKPGSEASA